ncbi:MAG: hypothetical protein IJO50_02965 [Clostridia bacterium]|nr:hypothetical protein [Clostridia bacterium]
MKKIKFNMSTLLYGLVLVLFCLTASTSLMSLRYIARFSSNSGGGDGSRVAAFVVNFNKGDDVYINTDAYVDNGTYAQYTNTDNYEEVYSFDVTNKNALGKVSEVAMRHKVQITVPAFPGDMNDSVKTKWNTVINSMTLYAVDGSTRTKCTLTKNGQVYESDWLEDFPAGTDTTYHYELAFNGYNFTFYGSYTAADIMEYSLEGFTVNVQTEQID